MRSHGVSMPCKAWDIRFKQLVEICHVESAPQDHLHIQRAQRCPPLSLQIPYIDIQPLPYHKSFKIQLTHSTHSIQALLASPRLPIHTFTCLLLTSMSSVGSSLCRSVSTTASSIRGCRCVLGNGDLGVHCGIRGALGCVR